MHFLSHLQIIFYCESILCHFKFAVELVSKELLCGRKVALVIQCCEVTTTRTEINYVIKCLLV